MAAAALAAAKREERDGRLEGFVPRLEEGGLCSDGRSEAWQEKARRWRPATGKRRWPARTAMEVELMRN